MSLLGAARGKRGGEERGERGKGGPDQVGGSIFVAWPELSYGFNGEKYFDFFVVRLNPANTKYIISNGLIRNPVRGAFFPPVVAANEDCSIALRPPIGISWHGL